MDDGTTIPSLDFSMTSCRNEFQCDVNLTLILVFDMTLLDIVLEYILVVIEA